MVRPVRVVAFRVQRIREPVTSIANLAVNASFAAVVLRELITGPHASTPLHVPSAERRAGSGAALGGTAVACTHDLRAARDAVAWRKDLALGLQKPSVAARDVGGVALALDAEAAVVFEPAGGGFDRGS